MPYSINVQGDAQWRAERKAQTDLVREVFGDPNRTVEVRSTWLAWNGGTVRILGQSAYAERSRAI
jgi:hypothetical protein